MSKKDTTKMVSETALQYHPKWRHHCIKLGKLHSSSNLKLRAQYFEKKYEKCFRTMQLSDSIEENFSGSSFGRYWRNPSAGFKGFEFKSSDLEQFYMLQEMIEELEMHEDFTSDEESETYVKVPQPIILPVCFDFEKGFTCEDNTSQSRIENDQLSDDSNSSEGEFVPQRPFSRLSLEVEKYNETYSGYQSDDTISRSGTSCWESEDESDNPNKSVYGNVAGTAVGNVWKNRRDVSKSLVHIPCKARIHGGKKGGYSIVLSNPHMVKDAGVHFRYFGEAKLDFKTDSTMAIQRLIGANAVLQNNLLKGIPIRVIRSYKLGNSFAPRKGYRYDGLYDVKSVTEGKIRNGYQFCEFTLVRSPNQPPPPWATSASPAGDVPSYLLSSTEIHYNTEDECDNGTERKKEENITTYSSSGRDLLGSRSKSTPIVVLKRLSAREIEKVGNVISTSKELHRLPHSFQQGTFKQTENQFLVHEKNKKKAAKTKQEFSKKTSKSALQTKKLTKQEKSKIQLRKTSNQEKIRSSQAREKTHSAEQSTVSDSEETTSVKRKRLLFPSLKELTTKSKKPVSKSKEKLNDDGRSVQKSSKKKSREVKAVTKTLQGSPSKSSDKKGNIWDLFIADLSKNPKHNIDSRKSTFSKALASQQLMRPVNSASRKKILQDKKKINSVAEDSKVQAGSHFRKSSKEDRKLSGEKHKYQTENRPAKTITRTRSIIKQKSGSKAKGAVIQEQGSRTPVKKKKSC